MERQICKHFMYGYCKFQDNCQERHINVLCPNYRDCDNNGCVNRHPKVCKYFDKRGKCKFENCAYLHVKEGINLKVEILEKQVAALILEIEELKKTNTEGNIKSDQFDKFNNNINDILARLRIVEQEQTKHKEMEETVENRHGEAVMNSKKREENKMPASIEITHDDKDITEKKNNFECDQRNFILNKKITQNKHINTKHNHKELENDTETKTINSECSLCEDIFSSYEKLEKHKREHIEEIEGLDIASLTNDHDMFECNLCSFESGVGDSIREHLVDHVNPPIEEEPTTIIMNNGESPKSLLDEYDDDGNYIGDNPKFMDSDENDSDEE